MKEFIDYLNELVTSGIFTEQEETTLFNAFMMDDYETIENTLTEILKNDYSLYIHKLYSMFRLAVNMEARSELIYDLLVDQQEESDQLFFLGVCMN